MSTARGVHEDKPPVAAITNHVPLPQLGTARQGGFSLVSTFNPHLPLMCRDPGAKSRCIRVRPHLLPVIIRKTTLVKARRSRSVAHRSTLCALEADAQVYPKTNVPYPTPLYLANDTTSLAVAHRRSKLVSTPGSPLPTGILPYDLKHPVSQNRRAAHYLKPTAIGVRSQIHYSEIASEDTQTRLYQTMAPSI
ncbi:hypothetical protein BDV98DRAFT_107585 [Pterulicium gracile]|uniref:Uncharacterized protein n=1 Tax=Pterulicium gracile TaxID=1884261 RepID=A0A5C3QH99_9AGAR|nr:hypothetical protein BDV98DRAFT_107585 [Pterula gracilis]